MPRRQSLSSNQGPLTSPRDSAGPSPRTRTGFDGVFSGGDSWVARRKAAEAQAKSAAASRGEPAGETDSKAVEIKEEEDEEPNFATAVNLEVKAGSNTQSTPEQFNTTPIINEASKEMENIDEDMGNLSLDYTNQPIPEALSAVGMAATSLAPGPPPTQNQPDLATVEWSYLDPQGNVQGKHPSLAPCPSQVTTPTYSFAFLSRTIRC